MTASISSSPHTPKIRVIWGLILFVGVGLVLVAGSPLIELALCWVVYRLSFEWVSFKGVPPCSLPPTTLLRGKWAMALPLLALIAIALIQRIWGHMVTVASCLGDMAFNRMVDGLLLPAPSGGMGCLFELILIAAIAIAWFIMVPRPLRRWTLLGITYFLPAVLSVLWLSTATWSASIPLFWIVVVVTVVDTLAYAGGSYLQGPKVAPMISPGKTWSGIWCGLLGGAAVGGVLMAGLGSLTKLGVLAGTGEVPPWGESFIQGFGIGAGVALAAIVGDLLESYVKRTHGVKDAPSLIPGHGGLLDRFDGYLLALPVATLLFWKYIFWL